MGCRDGMGWDGRDGTYDVLYDVRTERSMRGAGRRGSDRISWAAQIDDTVEIQYIAWWPSVS